MSNIIHLFDPTDTDPLVTHADGTVCARSRASALGTGERQPGRATEFDGSTQYATLGARVTSGALTSLSVVAWAKPDSTSTDILVSEYSTAGRAWRIGTASGKVRVILSSDGTFTSGTAKDYVSQGSLSSTQWYLFAFTFGSSNLDVYLNGEEITCDLDFDAAMSSIYDSTSHYVIGSNDGGTAAAVWANPIFGVGVTTEALTAAQHLALYEQGTKYCDRWTGIYESISWNALHWLDDGSITTARDASGNGNDLTIAAGDSGILYTGTDVPFSPQNLRGFTEA